MGKKFLEPIHAIKRPGVNELENFLLESDFFRAPASTKFHLSVAGGLALHSWNVYKALEPIAAKHVPGVDPDSIVVCGLLHDICKANFYKPEMRNRKNDRGQWESYACYGIEDKDPLGHGEKSVIILQRFIRLTDEEALAIRWHMGAWEAESYSEKQALNAAIDKSPLTRALILADTFSTFFMETNTEVKSK